MHLPLIIAEARPSTTLSETSVGRTALDATALPPIMPDDMMDVRRYPISENTHGLVMLWVFQTTVGRTARG
jgi:hypothetical protein